MNTWINRKKNRISKKEELSYLIKLLLFVIFICGIMWLDAEPVTSRYTNSYSYSTWFCDQCGYENYTRINHCEVYGNKKT